MKDELRLYCMNEGLDKEFLLAQLAESKKLSKLEKKRSKSRNVCPESRCDKGGKENAKR